MDMKPEMRTYLIKKLGWIFLVIFGVTCYAYHAFSTVKCIHGEAPMPIFKLSMATVENKSVSVPQTTTNMPVSQTAPSMPVSKSTTSILALQTPKSMSVSQTMEVKHNENISIHVINPPVHKQGMKYAVMSCVPALIDSNINYAFYLPTNVYMWQRLGFHTISLLVGSPEEWSSRRPLKLIVDELHKAGSTYIFIDVPQKNRIMISQVSRLFIAALIDWTGAEDAYIVMSDTDLWPVQSAVYDLRQNKTILSLNSGCCGRFTHKGKSYSMLPMCNVGMTVNTWKQVMQFQNISRFSDSQQIIDYVINEFGPFAGETVHKGENSGWYLDQHLISIRIQQWIDVYGSQTVSYVPRNTRTDRIDRSRWSPNPGPRTIDAHMLHFAYRSGTWEKVRPLIRILFKDNSKMTEWFENYRNNFLRTLS